MLKKSKIDAWVSCKYTIEQSAKYSHEWADSWAGEQKYPFISWVNKSKGIVTLKGRQLKFQNGLAHGKKSHMNAIGTLDLKV